MYWKWLMHYLRRAPSAVLRIRAVWSFYHDDLGIVTDDLHMCEREEGGLILSLKVFQDARWPFGQCSPGFLNCISQITQERKCWSMMSYCVCHGQYRAFLTILMAEARVFWFCAHTTGALRHVRLPSDHVSLRVKLEKPVTATFGVNASRVIPPLTIPNVKLIYFRKDGIRHRLKEGTENTYFCLILFSILFKSKTDEVFVSW